MDKTAVVILCILNLSWICAPAQSPTTQASINSASGGSSSNITIGWTSGNGTKRLLIGSIGQSVDFTPTDNTTYTANSSFGSGTNLGGGMYVLYNGTGSSTSVSSLNASSQYTFRLYEYNGSAGAEKYLSTTSGASGSMTGCGGGSNWGCIFAGNPITVAYNSGTQVTNLQFKTVTSTSVNVLYYADNSTSILVASTTPLAGAPSGSTKYCAMPTYGSGDAIGNGYVVGAISGCSGWGCSYFPGGGSAQFVIPVTGLSPNTTYYFRAFEQSSGCASSWATGTGTGNDNTQTVKTTPNIVASNITFSGTTTSQTTLNWTNGNGAKRIIVASLSTPSGPSDGIVYGANSVFGSGNDIGGSSYVVYDGTGTTATVTGLSAGFTYNFAVYEYNNPGTYFSVYGAAATASVITIPPSPTVATATNVTDVSFSANWSASLLATGYFLDVSTVSDFSSFVTGYNDLSVGNVTTYAVNSNLIANTPYYFRVRATNITGTSINSSTGTVTTGPAPPTGVVATSVTDASFSANWNASTAATGYSLDISTVSNFSSFVTGYNNLSVGNVTTYSVNSNVSGNTQYYFRVRANNTNGTSNNSSSGTLTTAPAAPTLSSFSSSNVTNNSFSANWSSSAGASTYYVDVSTASNFSSFVTGYNSLNVGNVTTYVVNSNLSANALYYVRVRASSSNGISNSSVSKSLTTAPAPPTVSAATNVTDVSFSADWSASTAATGYFLDVSTVSNFSSFVTGYNNLSVGNVTTYSVNSNLSANTPYYVRVRAANTNGTSASSGSGSLTTAPAPPTVSATTNVTDVSFSANWSASTAATGYFLDVSTASNFSSFVTGYNNLSVGNVTTYAVNSNLTANTPYYVRIRATNTNGTSNSSSNGSLTTAPAPPTVSTATTITDVSFSANWSASASATGYSLDVSTVSNFSSFVSGYNNLSVGNVTTYSVNSNVSANTVYYVRVRATNNNGISSSSSSGSLTTAPPPPTASAATNLTDVSFTANWSASTGAVGYYLDVSTASNFSSFVTGYSNLNVGNVTTYAVNSNLSGNTSYYVRVRASNTASVPSINSNAIPVTTLSSAPVAVAATQQSQTSFVANWNSIAGITNFRLDVSSNDFSSMLTGYNDAAVTGVSSTVSGLSAGQTYKYRLRAVNGSGSSSNSNFISIITVPPNVTGLQATSPAQDGFTLNWNPSTGAGGYLLFLSEQSDFSTLVTGYNPKNLSITNEVISGLKNGTTYYARVQSSNNSGVSGFSSVTSQITIPATPTLQPTDISLVSSTSFVAKWNSVTGADAYELTVVDVASNTVANGFPVAIVAPEVLLFAQNLTPSKLYKYTLRAKNAAGFSPSSSYQLVQMHDASGGTNAPSVSVDASKSSIASIKVNTTGSILPLQLIFKHRKITDDKFVAESSVVNVSSSSITQTIDPSWSDELGFEYYFVLKDAANQVDSAKTSSYIYKSYASQNIVGFESGFTGSPSGYRMFSIPASFASKRVDEIFQAVFSQFGGYDKKKWRMFHYNSSKGDYDEFQSGFTTIDEGVGYWFNAAETPASVSITTGVISANQTAPATFTLAKGWNQIGNPYPFNVDWTAVQAASAAAGLNSLWVYDAGNYIKKTVLAAWKGAFVFSDNGGSLVFPVKSRTTASGRIAQNEMNETLDEKRWLVPLTLELNDISQTSSIGMHPEASLSKDKFDEVAVPRFIEYLEMNTVHKEFFSPYFSSDVVPPQDKYEWTFDLASSQSGSAVLSWDQQALKENVSSLLLIDLTDQKWIDMKSFSSYRFSWKEGRQMKMVYAREGAIYPGVTLLGQSYPNPFTGTVTIPILVEEGNLHVQVNVFDLVGRKVKTISTVFDSPGPQEIQWDGRDDAGNETAAGVLIYKVMNISSLSAKRMVKQ